MTPAMIVILHLSVHDPDTGNLLYDNHGGSPLHQFSISGQQIEDCRVYGVEEAKKLSAYYRQWYPHAFTNVDCEWEQKGDDL